MSDDLDAGGAPRAKSVLFCAVCGHESPADGDWEESTSDGALGPRLVLSCPDCEATVTRRPVHEGDQHVSAVVADD